MDRAIKAGAKLEGNVQNNRWGRLANIADPFGHGLCPIQFTGRGYDQLLAP
ncbi:MAG TPA: hypothetical protein VE549_15575 [Myxococcaceae bacterium]|nr:hypothetical protein [Myxococcaceae bacterium]